MNKGSAIPSYLSYLVLVENKNLLLYLLIYVLKQIAKKGVTPMAGVITSCNIRENAAIRSLKGMAAGVPLIEKVTGAISSCSPNIFGAPKNYA